MNLFLGSFDSAIPVNNLLITPLPNLISLTNNLLVDQEAAISEGDHVLFISGNVFSYAGSGISYNCEFPMWLLQIFKEKNFDELEHIDGEFMAICASSKELMVYRDKSNGSTPFFYTDKHFGSQISLLKNFKSQEIEINSELLAEYLGQGYVSAPNTLFSGIQKLQGGNLFHYNNGTGVVHELFDFKNYRSKLSAVPSQEKLLTQFGAIHQKSIGDRIKDKQKIAALMSGGFDSGGVVYGLRQNLNKDTVINAFSVGFKGSELSEIPYAKIMADKFQANLNVYEITGQEIDVFPQVVSALEEPFHECGMMINYLAMKMAAEDKSEITLGGDGNDQLYGTGSWYLSISWLVHKFRLSALFKLLYNLLPKKLNSSSYRYFQIQFHLYNILNPLSTGRFGFKKHELKKMIHAKMKDRKDKNIPTQSFNDFYGYVNFHKDILHDAFHVIIFKASRMASHFKINLSFPYISVSSFNFLASLPANCKVKGSFKDIIKRKGKEKYLLKDYLNDKLPYEITHKKKQGGFVPLTIFLKDHKLNTIIKNVILSSPVIDKYFKKNAVESFLSMMDDFLLLPETSLWQKQAYGTRLFNLLSLVVWWEKNVLLDKSNTLTEMTKKPLAVKD